MKYWSVLWFKKSFTFLSFFCLISARDVCPRVCVCVNESVFLCAHMMHVCEGGRLMLVTPLMCNYYLLYHKLYELPVLYKDKVYTKLIQKIKNLSIKTERHLCF